MNWDDLRLLLAVSRAGSYSAAARHLGVNQSTISRRLHRLQERTGTVLVERRPDGVILTQAGTQLCALAEGTETEIALTLGRVAGEGTALDGPLTLTCVDMMVDRFLAPHLEAFLQAHPGIDLTVLGQMQTVDLLRGQADIALRVSRGPDDRLTGRRLCDFGLGVYRAASASADGWIGWAGGHRVEANLPSRLQHLPVLHHADNFLVMNAMVRAGLGLAVLPCYWADADVTLRRAHPDPVSHPDLGLWLLYHPDRKQAPRLRAFIDFITSRFTAQRAMFSGRATGTA